MMDVSLRALGQRRPQGISLNKGAMDFLTIIASKPGCQIVVSDNARARPRAFLCHSIDRDYYHTMPAKYASLFDALGIIEPCGRDCNGVRWRLSAKGEWVVRSMR